jgi:hypothetical protein
MHKEVRKDLKVNFERHFRELHQKVDMKLLRIEKIQQPFVKND